MFQGYSGAPQDEIVYCVELIASRPQFSGHMDQRNSSASQKTYSCNWFYTWEFIFISSFVVSTENEKYY
jgi:hypothetical protein